MNSFLFSSLVAIILVCTQVCADPEIQSDETLFSHNCADIYRYPGIGWEYEDVFAPTLPVQSLGRLQQTALQLKESCDEDYKNGTGTMLEKLRSERLFLLYSLAVQRTRHTAWDEAQNKLSESILRNFNEEIAMIELNERGGVAPPNLLEGLKASKSVFLGKLYVVRENSGTLAK